MRDILLENLKATYSNISSLTESDQKYLTESKKRYAHLTESYLIENKPVIENIRTMSVSSKSIMNTFHISLAAARTLKKSYDAFAIAEYYARTETDETAFNDKLNESCKVILELEGEFNPEASIDPNSPEAQQWSRNMAATKGKGMDDTIGPKIDTSSGKAAPEVEKKKKGFLTKVKDFLGKTGEVIKKVATSKETYKVLAISAAMVVLGLIAASIGGWVAIGFTGLKGLLGLFSIFKGSKELIKTSDFAQGKKGVDGVAQWIKSSKDPKNAAKIILAISQVALGSWGASSAVGQAMQQVAVMDAMKTYNPDGNTVIKAAAPTAPTAAPVAAPAPAPVAPPEAAAQVAAHAPTSIETIKSSARHLQQAIESGSTNRTGLYAQQLISGLKDSVASGELTQDKAVAIIKHLGQKAVDHPEIMGRMTPIAYGSGDALGKALGDALLSLKK